MLLHVHGHKSLSTTPSSPYPGLQPHAGLLTGEQLAGAHRLDANPRP